MRPFGTSVMNVALIMLVAAGAATVVAVLLRLGRARGVEREQLKWLTYAGALTVTGWLLLLPRELGFGSGSPPGLLDLAGAALTAVGGIAIPVAVGVAILRYRLYDIDLLITRTVVYGLLTALVTAVYLVIVVGIGTLVGSRGNQNLFLSIVATAVIAAAFQPARERRRRLATRLVYGERASPYEVLSEFSRGMAGASTDDSLLQMTRLVVEATGVDQATVWLRLGEQLQPQARWPQTGLPPKPMTLDGRSPDSLSIWHVEIARSRVQESLKCFNECNATKVVELLQVVGEVGKADFVLWIRERYLSTQTIVAKRFLSEEGAAFGGEHKPGAPSLPRAREWEEWLTGALLSAHVGNNLIVQQPDAFGV